MIKSSFKLLEVVLWFVPFVFFGCMGQYHIPDRYYVPKAIPIKPDMIEKPVVFFVSKNVVVSNDQSNMKEPSGEYFHPWHANPGYWTDTAVELCKSELEKRSSPCSEETKKILKLVVTRVNLTWETREITCDLTLRVETGNGYQKTYSVTGASQSLFSSSDNAITRAIAALLNDRQIRAYLIPPDSDQDGVCDYDDKCPSTPPGINVDETGCPADTDGDGVPDYRDQCPDTPREARVDEKGCPVDTDGDGVPDYKDKCPDTPRGVKVDEQGCPEEISFFFENDKHDIKPDFHPGLDRLAATMQKNPDIKIEIQGHTDDMGTEAYNQALSEKRTKAVSEYLEKKGVAKDRILTVGYGYSRPRSTDKTESGRAMNRRVSCVWVQAK